MDWELIYTILISIVIYMYIYSQQYILSSLLYVIAVIPVHITTILIMNILC